MSLLANTKRDQFTKAIRELTTLLDCIQENLNSLYSDNSDNKQAVPLKQLLMEMSQLSQCIRLLLTLPIVTLFEEEYLDFCDLLVCGTEMADYLKERHSTSRKACGHAVYWRQLVQRFRPFLQRVLQLYQPVE